MSASPPPPPPGQGSHAAPQEDEDTVMQPAGPAVGGEGGEDEEGEGESVGSHRAMEDSSEEEEEGSEEERAVRDGFIADEDEDVIEERKKKRRKHKHKRKKRKAPVVDDEAGDLDEDDLDLVAENTGVRRRKPERRLRRAGSVASDDLDNDRGLAAIFDEDEDEEQDEEPSRRHDGYGEEMADFIEDDEFDDDGHAEGASRPSKGKAPARSTAPSRQSQVGRMMGALAPDVAGISKEVWDEVMEVFGNGEEYAWAMELDPVDDGAEVDLDGVPKHQLSLRDIFEPSELKDRMLTDADDAIRLLDVPERTQLASVGLANATSIEPLLDEEELQQGVDWISKRISERCNKEFLQKDNGGFFPTLREPFLQCVYNVLKFFTVDFLEVPFVQMHRRDYITHHDAHDPGQRQKYFLMHDDVWRVHTLSFKFRALLERKRGLHRVFSKLGVEDEYFDECFAQIESVEEVTDLTLWLNMHHASRIRDVQADMNDLDTTLGGAAENPRGGAAQKAVKYKKPSRETRYERAKNSPCKQLADNIGISAQELAADFVGRNKMHFTEDPPKPPHEYASEFAVESTEFDGANKALEAAKLIVSTEIGKDPMLKKHVRDLFKLDGAISVSPTDKGLASIEEIHPYYSFKYLRQKPFSAFHLSSQFLQILGAEQEALVTVQVHLNTDTEYQLKKELLEMYKSDGTSELATSWNELREEVLLLAVEQTLLPEAAKWAKNFLREESENHLAQRCTDLLDDRIGVAPFRSKGLEEGDVPSVVAISQSAGDPRRSSVFVVYLDDQGRFRDHMMVDNLKDEPNREELEKFLEKRKPEVIVVGGFNASTHRLIQDVKQVSSNLSNKMKNEVQEEYEDDPEALNRLDFPVISVRDDTARLYQHSKRAENELGPLSPTIKYCVALARYVQSPLNEYAALGSDLTAVSFTPEQQLLPREILQDALDRALVNVVNLVGVDVNRSVHDTYYQQLLPYVCGLGPRKAQKLVKAVNNAIDGTLRTRDELITEDIVTKNVFYNCSPFLRIIQDDVATNVQTRDVEPDILDDTRIHPEDYHIARKMAADAQELDEEDLAEQHPSQVVSDLMADHQAIKLDDLNLDDFANELERLLSTRKRWILYQIRDELQNPYKERRRRFTPLDPAQLFDLLTGESEATLSRGLVIPVKVLRVRDDGLLVRLDSGVEGRIERSYMTDEGLADLSKFPVGSTIQAQVMEVHKDRFYVELNCQPSAVGAGAVRRSVFADQYFDAVQEKIDKDSAEARRKKSGERNRRVIKHPNFHNFNAGQAEQYLASQQRGDCVIRPSSRGTDHLAVTWKVDEGVYQHIDVLELDKPNEFSLGRTLKISRYTYADLDELIVSHVRSIARKVEEMMAHDKYKGNKEELAAFLSTSLMANPDKSTYGFALDKEKAGQFLLGFRADKSRPMISWPVKVLPGSFDLNGAQDLPDMNAVCNSFKLQYSNRAAGAGVVPSGSRTSYGRTPYGGGHQTPQRQNGTPRAPQYGAPLMPPGVPPPAVYGQQPGWGGRPPPPVMPPQQPQQQSYGGGYGSYR